MKLVPLEGFYMNILFYNLFFFVCVIPIWVFKFALNNELIIVIFLIFLLLLSFHNLILKKIKKRKNLYFFYLALILTYGIDNHLGIFSDFIAPNAKFFRPVNSYLIGLFTLISIFLLNVFIIKKLEIKGVFIIFSFILTCLLFSIQFSDKSIKNLPDFQAKDLKKKFNKITLIFVMDQMAGIDSDASKTELGKKFDDLAFQFSKKYKAELYTNVYSQCSMTFESIPKLINFDTLDNCKKLKEKNYIKKSENFFNEYEIINNKFFDKFKSISVFQNYHMNFCKNKNVTKCNQYSQFKEYNYIQGFKNNTLSKIIGGWKHYGSISANFTWRALLTLNLIDSYEQASGEKGAFISILNNIYDDITTHKYDLIFTHSLSTHEPYGFDGKCDYSGKRYINYSKKNLSEAIKGQNYDRTCILRSFDIFFEKLDKKNILNKIEFVILSDHGTRLSADEDSSLKTIFIYKGIKKKFRRVTARNTLQETLSLIFD